MSADACVDWDVLLSFAPSCGMCPVHLRVLSDTMEHDLVSRSSSPNLPRLQHIVCIAVDSCSHASRHFYVWLLCVSFMVAIMPVLYSMVDKQSTCGPFQFVLFFESIEFRKELRACLRCDPTDDRHLPQSVPSSPFLLKLSGFFREPLLYAGTPAVLGPALVLLVFVTPLYR